jgi:hypothetical protein
MRRYGVVAIVLAACQLGLVSAAEPAGSKQKPLGRPPVLGAIASPARTVEMVIDYGDGVQTRFTALPWREKMTVLDAVNAAAAHPHGVKSSVRGSGANAFVTQIADVKNEGGGKESKNWLFSVNGVESEVGVGAAPLKPADVVLWRFGLPDNNSNAN